jgi:hypothetical protein
MVTQLGVSALAVPDSSVRMLLDELQLVFAHLPILPGHRSRQSATHATSAVERTPPYLAD